MTKKEIIVLSLGGSLIIPNEVNEKYLSKLKKIILKNTRKYKFIFVCGGGSIARKYIKALEKSHRSFQAYAGISSTRTNARFMSYFFGLDPEKGIPSKIKDVKKRIKKQNVVFCGALEYDPNQTSDSTAAIIAKEFKAKFVNLTNVKGLYTKDPRKFKGAKLIREISWDEFYTIAHKIKFKPGQHFVLDQVASRIIKENKIPTCILGPNLKQLNNFLNGKDFVGTIIEG